MKKIVFIFAILLISFLIIPKTLDQEKLNKELYDAAGFSNLMQVQKLISLGANINSREGLLGWTPLMKTLDGKSTKAKKAVFDYLLQNGADVNIKSDADSNALHIAVCDSSRFDEINDLIKAGININLQNKYGTTPLSNAVFFDNAKIVELLINNGADVNLAKTNGMTPLMVACKDNKATSIVDLLIKAKADIKAKNENGDTAMDIAKSHNIRASVDLLRNAGAED